MFVAVDDTDSMLGNCTTFLATEIIRELSDLDLIGNPQLVRLNPATPWKTRGNGSLIMRFGRGKGKKQFIGCISNKKIYCYSEAEDWEPNPDDLVNKIIPIIEKYHEDDANPGLIVSYIKPDPKFYWNGVRTIMDRQIINQEIKRINAKHFEIGNGRGVIGSICGMAWVPSDSTFELLSYRPMDRWGTVRSFEHDSIREMDSMYSSTFNSWEEREQKVAMVPSTPCPVMYGLRGDNLEDLIEASKIIKTEEIERWIIFLTNQGTDDHIIENPEELIPNQSYKISGIVKSSCKHIPGSHVLIDILTDFGIITCAAYEPSKEFRLVFDNLRAGDRLNVLGELRDEPRTLNVEKIQVISLAEDIVKISNPSCPDCGRKMDSIGKNQGYRCKKCHVKVKDYISKSETRWIVPGWYEPPTAARRHLSKPLKRMNEEQPLGFVNRRIW